MEDPAAMRSSVTYVSMRLDLLACPKMVSYGEVLPPGTS
jgi:hypothetical protein